tara:strand:+ start:1321 stop:1776 length:456 start_codon:yes stop_codon:yes gene_type:complete
MLSNFLLFSELNITEQIIISGMRTWANNIRLNKDPILALKCFYKPFNLENVSTLIDELMSAICIGYKVHLDFRCNCNMIISNHEQTILETLYYSQIKFYDLERKTLSIIVKDKYKREVMFVNKKINEFLIKNKYKFECRDSYFNSNIKCFN